MIHAMRPFEAKKDSSIIRQGEYGSVLYVLEGISKELTITRLKY